MFDEKDYKAAFSKVTASGETHRRILNMANEKRKHRSSGVVTKILIAAVMVSLLAVTASASELVRSWFATYFEEESEVPLSYEQVEVIEENVQDISQKRTCNGYTMEVKSVLTDGYNMFIAIGITAPENVTLDRTVKEGYDPEAPVLWLGENSRFEIGDRGYSMTWNMSDDGDGLANTHNIVYLISAGDKTFTEGDTLQIHIEDLYAEYTNAAYAKELEEKYGFEPKLGQITDEEVEKLYPVELLAEGTWDFEIQFEEINIPIVEVVDQPVDYVMQARTESNGAEVDVNTKITSIRISPIGVICEYEAVDYPIIKGILGNIVMKNGDTYSLAGNAIGGCGDTSSNGMFAVPIALEDIDHIDLMGGIKLRMPELSAE